MRRNRFSVVLAVAGAAILAFAAPADAAVITIGNQAEGFLGSNKTLVTTTHNGSTLLDYDATGLSKLVVAIGTESGFNNQGVTVTGVTFNGVALTQAVQENTRPTPVTAGDGGTAAIFYLDAPYQGTSTFTVSATTTAGGLNGGWVSIIGLTGTADGIGNTGASWYNDVSGSLSTSITTLSNDSLVIAAIENSGNNNGAGTPTVVAPLTLSNNGSWGNQWGGAASGYQFVTASGTTITPTFSTNLGHSIHVIAAEFRVVPEPGTFVLVASGLLALAWFHRRRKR